MLFKTKPLGRASAVSSTCTFVESMAKDIMGRDACLQQAGGKTPGPIIIP